MAGNKKRAGGAAAPVRTDRMGDAQGNTWGTVTGGVTHNQRGRKLTNRGQTVKSAGLRPRPAKPTPAARKAK